MKTAVHVTSKEEWDIVLRSVRRDGGYYDSFDQYPENCLDLSDGRYCSRSYFEEEEYDILSFEEWLDKYDPENSVATLPITPTLIQVPII